MPSVISRREALDAIAQRAAVAVQIKNDRLAVARRHVPGDDVLAVGRGQRDFFGLRQAGRGRRGVDGFGKIHQRALREIKHRQHAGIDAQHADDDPHQHRHRALARPDAGQCFPRRFPRPGDDLARNRKRQPSEPSHFGDDSLRSAGALDNRILLIRCEGAHDHVSRGFYRHCRMKQLRITCGMAAKRSCA